MKKILLGSKVFSAAVKDKAMRILGAEYNHPEEYFDPTPRVTMTEISDNDLSDTEIWSRARTIQKAALECGNKDLSEAAWNDEVNSRLLNLALRSERQSKNIWYRNITSAKITDKSLLDRAPGSKMVDYCLIIDS